MYEKALAKLNVTDFVIRGNPETVEEFKKSFVKIVGKDENGNAIESSEDIHKDFNVDHVHKIAKREERKEKRRKLRAERNKRLTKTDWWASSDLTMSSEQKRYRQSLRDITDRFDTLDDVEWPEEP